MTTKIQKQMSEAVNAFTEALRTLALEEVRKQVRQINFFQDPSPRRKTSPSARKVILLGSAQVTRKDPKKAREVSEAPATVGLDQLNLLLSANRKVIRNRLWRLTNKAKTTGKLSTKEKEQMVELKEWLEKDFVKAEKKA